MTVVLSVEDITKTFGGVRALDSISMVVHENEVLGLIGPNGAGKTTLINVISGLYKPDSGSIKFRGRRIDTLTPPSIIRLGIARTFQIPQLFRNFTILNNVIAGAIFSRTTQSLKTAYNEATYWINFVGLGGKEDLKLSEMTMVEERLTEIARCLAAKPKLIMLDEVLAGLTASEISEVTDLVRKISSELNITILWVEHVLKALMKLADRLIVLNYGQKIADGAPEEVIKDKQVLESYLGGEAISLR